MLINKKDGAKIFIKMREANERRVGKTFQQSHKKWRNIQMEKIIPFSREVVGGPIAFFSILVVSCLPAAC